MKRAKVPLGRVRCRFCKKTHKVSSYQSFSFGHSAFCDVFAITVSCSAKWTRQGRKHPQLVFRMLDNYLGERITTCECTKCDGTGRQPLPKRFMRKK